MSSDEFGAVVRFGVVGVTATPAESLSVTLTVTDATPMPL